MKLTNFEGSELAKSLRHELDEAIVQHELSESDAERVRQQARIEILTLAHRRLTEVKLEGTQKEVAKAMTAIPTDAGRDVALSDLLSIAQRMTLGLLARTSGVAPAGDAALVIVLDPMRVMLVSNSGEIVCAPRTETLDSEIIQELGDTAGAFAVAALNQLTPESRASIGAALRGGAVLTLTVMQHAAVLTLDANAQSVEIARATLAIH